MWTMFCLFRAWDREVRRREKAKQGGEKRTHIVNHEIQITRRNHLPIQQTPSLCCPTSIRGSSLPPTNPTNTPTRPLHRHHLLHHLLLIRIQETRQLTRVQTRIQLQKTPQRRHGRLRAHVREEEREVAVDGFGWL